MQDGALSEGEVDHIIGQMPLKIAEPVVWSREGNFLKAKVSVVGVGVNTNLVMDITVSSRLPGKYTFNLRQRDCCRFG